MSEPIPAYTAVQQPQPVVQNYPQQPIQAYTTPQYEAQPSEKGPAVQIQQMPVHQQQQPMQQVHQGQQPQQAAQPLFQPRTYQTATPLNVLGRSGAPVDCPVCGQRTMSRTTPVIGNSNHVWAGAVCLLTGFFCFIPYLMDSLKNVEHRCGGCGVLLATVHKSGTVDVHQFH